MDKTKKIFIFFSILLVAFGINHVARLNHSPANKDNSFNFISKSNPLSSRKTSKAADINNILWMAPNPSPKGENWMFDLFTSPTILKKENEFLATLPWLNRVEEAINFEVVSIQKKAYPLQFSGYFSAPVIDDVVSKSTGYIFLLQDAENNTSITARLGEKIENRDIEVRRFEENGPNGEINDYPRLVLFDIQIQREVILTSTSVYYDDLWTIELRSKIDGQIISLSHIGEVFAIGTDIYTLRRVDFEKKLLEFSPQIGESTRIFSLSVVTEEPSEHQRSPE